MCRTQQLIFYNQTGGKYFPFGNIDDFILKISFLYMEDFQVKKLLLFFLNKTIKILTSLLIGFLNRKVLDFL